MVSFSSMPSRIEVLGVGRERLAGVHGVEQLHGHENGLTRFVGWTLDELLRFSQRIDRDDDRRQGDHFRDHPDAADGAVAAGVECLGPGWPNTQGRDDREKRLW